MIEKIRKDKKLYYRIKGFGDGKVDHLFSTRIGWDQEEILKGLEDIFGLDDRNIYRGNQVHGERIVVIKDQPSSGVKDLEFDGLITNRRGKALVSYHGDCTPLYFYDPSKEAIGMGHSGWRGTFLGLGPKMVESLGLEYGSRPEDIRVAIGPNICRDCYEVKEDVAGKFLGKYPSYGEIVVEKNGSLYLDVEKVIVLSLLDKGILRGNIYRADFCTSCNSGELYSYRKEKTKSRMIGGIILK